jgi:UDP-N-acetylmuramyl pentapeptide phosphotransferase/UDP-N-acetylglucosamine-1-phosphate transferase
MSWYALISHLLFAGGLVIISAGLTWWMLHRVRIMDIPNSRSSHARPTPRGGGIAIVISFLLGIVAIDLLGDKTQISQRYFWGFLLSTLTIVSISLYDDMTGKSALVKLVTQVLAIIFVLFFGVVIDQVDLPWLGITELGWIGYPVTFFWLLGLTNAYNFMDGIDGLAAGAAVIVCVFFAYITLSQGSLFIYIVTYAVLAGALGFLFFNFPPAKIFMGDVGSAFLGFAFAVMAIMAARYDHSHTSFLVMPLLLLHFIFDTVFTMGRRILAGENPTHAHRTHLYQLLVRMGLSHRAVTLIYCALGILQGFAAIAMIHVYGGQRLFFFIPFLLIYTVAAWFIYRRAKSELII